MEVWGEDGEQGAQSPSGSTAGRSSSRFWAPAPPKALRVPCQGAPGGVCLLLLPWPRVAEPPSAGLGGLLVPSSWLRALSAPGFPCPLAWGPVCPGGQDWGRRGPHRQVHSRALLRPGEETTRPHRAGWSVSDQMRRQAELGMVRCAPRSRGFRSERRPGTGRAGLQVCPGLTVSSLVL